MTEILTKAERLALMRDSDPGDATADPNLFITNNDEWLNEHNRQALRFAIDTIEQITNTYKNILSDCIRNHDYLELSNLLNEIYEIIDTDPHAWGKFLQQRFFQWFHELSYNNDVSTNLEQKYDDDERLVDSLH